MFNQILKNKAAPTDVLQWCAQLFISVFNLSIGSSSKQDLTTSYGCLQNLITQAQTGHEHAKVLLVAFKQIMNRSEAVKRHLTKDLIKQLSEI